MTRSQFLAVFLLAAAPLLPAQSAKSGVVRPLSEAQLAPDEDRKCLQSALENGDPATGPSTFVLKAPPGCRVPWHFHTAEEQLIVVSGTVLTEMEGMPPRTLGAAGFALMPGKVKHQFSCESKQSCILFVTFNRAYDIVWVHDDAGK